MTVVLEALTKSLPRKDSSYRSTDQKSNQKRPFNCKGADHLEMKFVEIVRGIWFRNP